MAWTDVSTIHHFAFERDTSFARLFDEMSYGVTTIAGDTLSVSLPYDASDLTSAQWTQLALAEAESRGFDRSDYDRFLYVLPHLPKGATARGQASGSTGWCAFVSYIELGCLFHELGHTVGLQHAGELRPDGASDVYGDDSDGLMGAAFNDHVNIINKYLAGGWTRAGSTPSKDPGAPRSS